MQILYKPSFVRQYKKAPVELQVDIRERIEIFQKDPAHASLKTHKLHGRLQGCWSFSVNYQYRIVFQYTPSGDVEFLAFGDHDVYR